MNTAAINATHEDEAPASANPWVWPLALVGGLVLSLITTLHPTAFTMAKTWVTSSAYIHGIAVAPIAIWMIKAKARPFPTPSSFIPGILIMLASALIWLMGRAALVSLIEQFAFVSLLIGSVGVVFGAKALRAWAFPLGFLYFMVPFGEVLIPHLQMITAQLTISMLTLVGAEVGLEGNLITTPVGVFAVAEACAGLMFLIAAMMIASVFSYMNFHSWTKRLGFLCFAASIAILANGLRVFLIILTATLTDNQWAIGPDHILIGWLFYAAVFYILISVGVKHADKPKTRTLERQNAAPGFSKNYTGVKAALVILVATAIYSAFVIERPVARIAPASLTLLNAPGWRILPPPDNWRAALPHADRTAAATYTKQRSTVYVSMSYFTHDRRGAEIATYANRAWDGEEWLKINAINEAVYLFGQSKSAEFSILAGAERRRLALVTSYWLDDEIYFDPWRLKIAQMKSKLRGQNPAGGIIMIAASYTHHPDEAVQTIRDYTTDVEPLKRWLARNHVQ